MIVRWFWSALRTFHIFLLALAATACSRYHDYRDIELGRAGYVGRGALETVEDKDIAFYRIAYSDDKPISIEYYENGVKTVSPRGWMKAEVQRDENVTEIKFQNRQGRPEQGSGGYSSLRMEHSGDGSAWVTYLDPFGRSRAASSGSYQSRLQFSKDGSVSEVAYYDRARNPVTHREYNFHKKTTTQAQDGKSFVELHFASDGKPVPLRGENFHERRVELDADQNIVAVRYFGVSGLPVLRGSNGCAEEKFRYDLGLQVEWACFDEQGNARAFVSPVAASSVHRKTFQYDQRGRLTEERNYDIAGGPAFSPGLYHQARWVYDEHTVVQSFFGKRDEPVAPPSSGFHRLTSRFDSQNRLIETAIYDEEGKPATNPDGWHTAKLKFGEYDQIIERAYFGADGEPVIHRSLYAHRAVSDYDGQGRLVDYAVYGTNDSPVQVGRNTWHRVTYEYEENPDIVRIRYYDAAAEPVEEKQTAAHMILQKKDDRGDIVSISYFDRKGMPLSAVDSMCPTTRMQYNENGEPVEETYFDEQNKRCERDGGVHLIRRNFSTQGRIASESFLNSRLQTVPVINSDVYSVLYSYYPDGRLRETTFLDAGGERIVPSILNPGAGTLKR